MGYSTYVGRVGTLAVALGVGFSIASPAGIAWAETTETSSTGSTADAPSEPSESASTPQSTPDRDPAEDAAAEPAAEQAPSSPSSQTTEVAPGVVVSSSGGATTSEDEPEDEAESVDELAPPVKAKKANSRSTATSAPATSAQATARTAAPATTPSAQSTTAKATPAPAEAPKPAAAEPATAGVALEAQSSVAAVEPAARAAAPNVVDALVKAFVSPVVSSLLAAFPGNPATSPLGWLLLAAARREVGVAAPVETPQSAMMQRTAAVVATAAADPTGNLAELAGVDEAHAIAIAGNRAYVTNKTAGTVTVIDTTTNTVVRTFAAGVKPDAITVKPDGTQVFVASSENNTVTVVNTATGATARTISVASPSAIGISPSGQTLYVTSQSAGTLVKITTVFWNAATVKLPTGSAPTDLFVSPDISNIYVISRTANGGGTVSSVGANAYNSTLIANFASAPTSLAVSPDSKRLYVATTDGKVSVIDTTTRAVVGTHTVSGVPGAVSVAKDGTKLYVTDTAGVVSTLNASTGALLSTSVTRPVTTPMSVPPTTVVSADGTKLYVTDHDADKVYVVSLVAANQAPTVGAPVVNAPNATTGVLTGRVVATDPEGGPLRYTVAGAPTKGTVTVAADGSFTYTPTAAARHAAATVGAGAALTTDSFTVTVTDGSGAGTVAAITVNILPANKVPTMSTSVGNPAATGVVTGTVTVADGDGDALTYTFSQPTKGTVNFNAATRTFTYTATDAARHAAAALGAPAAAKTDTFTITVSDGHGGVVVKTVTVAVAPQNSAPATPVVNSQTDTNTGVVTGTVTATDADGDALTYTAGAAAKGELTMRPDGSFTYTPTAAARDAAAAPGATTATKTDTVTVTVTDGYGGTTTMTLNLTVAPSLPVGGGFQAANSTPAIGAVIGKVNPADPNAAGLSYTVATGPTRGLVKVDAATGAFTYVPNVDARYAAAQTPGVDTDTFTVRITDAAGTVTSVAVTVQVAPPSASTMDQRSTTIAVTAQEMYFFSQAETDMALDLLKQAGVTNIRILVPWMGVEPADDTWTWGAVDRMVNAAVARDIEVLAVLNSPPVWASVPDVPLLAGRPASPAEFAEYAGMVTTRYAGKIAAYEIWNEPNFWAFWAPGPNAAQYTEILKAAYPVIKAADPEAVVVAGSVAAVLDFFNITASPVRFVKEMYAAGAAGYFDALSVHPYLYGTEFSKGTATVQSPIWQLNEIYKLMVANGDGNKKIWATEYGQPSHLVSEESQAAFIADFLRTWRTLPYAGPAFIQTIKDNTESDPNAANMGLFRTDWTPKAALGVVSAIIAENAALLT
ncbi:VCBS repeat-containing protein/40-residue YVTN family beta-propeller repeat-containing protein [Mycolicibacterium rutilum]|uniref:VCBS repeat-containing protein/40-residue YVTN family beta-propeller repeat-containing protein n=1 Tax=Mycolicibacterium rutilum TaxID=370526 RepID=A0A1H6JHK1_MYCRU|nr:Ig-like domain-containing protein [Mycolicibacterium rutilum]SEH59900.1 VCBS repeat-containing protein/40-residue YVTN family beta-propeller repeat-containing protein [Mycolicibacterium rutilum]